MSLFTVLWGFALAWWLLWCFIALAKKAVAMLIFLIVTGCAWGAGVFAVGGIGMGGLEAPLPSFALFLVPLLILPPMVRIVTEYDRGVLFRLGRLKSVLTPGLNLVFPLGIDIVKKVDLRTFTIDVPKQEVITKDNVPVLVDAVVYFNVSDANLAITKVADFSKSTSLLSQTILRSVLGQHELDEMLSKRAELGATLQQLLDVATDPWGIKVTAVEIKAVELADTMKRAMARQAEAERERRAKIIAAEGELQASEKLTQAAAMIGTQPAALQLRYLQTLTEIAVEKNSTIIFPLPMELLKYFESRSKD
ncbi:MAG: membrane protease subunit, stomatin/prohibitin [Treponema sp. GWB1_62_6]|nr:MAG: membrane protease subunit, stomatin/prohibitin [Treponema sp. GWC1_61_84]OHE67649.1 MAG: membrane protease subunit, stomatin/prohibitin [Treponema sp. GWB1_62_6]OHE72278.1 MAG: membrane protease subunit, stomatin/prohibitin [Treponema sp. RIFOXYC1_FULL_61_9]HCM28267.1 membrane protease subunit, stomatin/prohibitin [Treponema sp.]